jgi:hypothetical protein
MVPITALLSSAQSPGLDVGASPSRYIDHPNALVSIQAAAEAGISDRETFCAALLHETKPSGKLAESNQSLASSTNENFGRICRDRVAVVVQAGTSFMRERSISSVSHLLPPSPGL